MRYLLYARKSSETEDRQVQSIEDQLSALRKLAQQRGLLVVEELVESKSAKAPGERPAFAHLLQMIQSGQADAILCWGINRLSRNPVDSGALSWMLQQGTLRCIQTVDREYRPEDNVLLMAVESGMANQYILDLRKVVLRGRHSKLEKGWYPHRAPEGYKNNAQDKTIEPDAERFVLLRRAWELMLTGAYTVPQVRQELTAWGYRTKKTKKSGGGPISRTALYNVFNNPFYMGELRCGGERYPGAHPPMLSPDEFLRVQRLLHREQHAQPQKQEWAFTGLIRCGACGCLVTAEKKVKRYPSTGRTRQYAYYHCTGRRGCPKESVPESYIEATISRLLEQCRISPAVADWCLAALERWEGQEHGTDAAAQEQQTKALRQLERKREGLLDMRAAGEITREEFAARKAQTDAEIHELQTGVAGAREKGRRDRESMENLLRFCGTAYARFTRGDARAKREVAHALGTGYVLTLGKLEIEPHPLLDVVRRFEPVISGSESTKTGASAPASPAWWDLLDDIRTLLAGSDVYFAKLPCG